MISLVGVAAFVTFMIQNTEKVWVHFLLWHFTWSRPGSRADATNGTGSLGRRQQKSAQFSRVTIP